MVTSLCIPVAYAGGIALDFDARCEIIFDATPIVLLLPVPFCIRSKPPPLPFYGTKIAAMNIPQARSEDFPSSFGGKSADMYIREINLGCSYSNAVAMDGPIDGNSYSNNNQPPIARDGTGGDKVVSTKMNSNCYCRRPGRPCRTCGRSPGRICVL